MLSEKKKTNKEVETIEINLQTPQQTPEQKIQRIIDDFGGKEMAFTSFKRNVDGKPIKTTSVYLSDSSGEGNERYSEKTNRYYTVRIEEVGNHNHMTLHSYTRKNGYSRFTDESQTPSFTKQYEGQFTLDHSLKAVKVKGNKILVDYDFNTIEGYSSNPLHYVFIFEVENLIPETSVTIDWP